MVVVAAARFARGGVCGVGTVGREEGGLGIEVFFSSFSFSVDSEGVG